jgi:hypothetical protein
MTPEISASTAQAPTSSSGFVNGVKRFFSFDNRFLAPVLVTVILLIGQLTFGFLESYWKTTLAITSAIALELLLGRIFTGKWPHPASSYISGISIGMLIRSPAIWPYILCSLISITSKYVIRVKDRHIWNPSNFGICAMLFLAPFSVASLSIQWGNTIWPMLVVWALGSIIIYRLKRFHICLTYVLSFIAFSYVRCLITGHPFLAEVAPITGPMYQLFVFFMITDPKTTVQSKWGQCVVAFFVAMMEMILRLSESVHAPYYALFIVGPLANLIEIWWKSRKTIADHGLRM